jgi:hypothetical protein
MKTPPESQPQNLQFEGFLPANNENNIIKKVDP